MEWKELSNTKQMAWNVRLQRLNSRKRVGDFESLPSSIEEHADVEKILCSDLKSQWIRFSRSFRRGVKSDLRNADSNAREKIIMIHKDRFILGFYIQ